MKYLALIPFVCCTIVFADHTPTKNTYLIERLSEAYQSNNSLIHKQAQKKDFECIELLTDNYIDQLKYIKILSDDQLQRKLHEQSTSFLTESIILKSHIVDIYERETLSMQKNRDGFLINENRRLHPPEVLWAEANALIYRTLNILNRLEEAPSLIEHLTGKINKDVLLRYNNKAIQANKLLMKSPQKLIINQIVPINESSETQRSYYAVGTMKTGDQSTHYLARISLIKKEYGLFFEDIQQIKNTKTIKRIISKLEGVKS